MRLHKIDVAQRQLETAITLFMTDGDPFSVITLAGASEEVLGCYDDGAWVKENPNNMFNRMFIEAKTRGLNFKSKKDFSHRLINSTKNALKHANHENEQFVELHPEEAFMRVLHALINFQLGSGKVFSERMSQFESWARANRPEYFSVTASHDGR